MLPMFLGSEINGVIAISYIRSITTVDYSTHALRPAYSVLERSKIESFFVATRSNWRYGIKIMVDSLQG